MHLKLFGPLLSHWFNKRPLGKSAPDPLLIIQRPLQEVPRKLLQGLGDNFWRIEQVRTEFNGGLTEQILSRGVQVVITAGPGDRYAEARAATRLAGVRWVAIPHCHEESWLLARYPHQSVNHWDVIGFQTDFARSIMRQHLVETSRELVARFDDIARVFGYLTLDQLNGVKRQDVLDRYRLPDDKPIILYAPFTTWPNRRTWNRMQNWLALHMFISGRLASAFARHVVCPMMINGVHLPLDNYESVLRKLRRLADNNGALLVAKSKARFRNIKADALVRRYTDAHIEDESFYPFTTTDLCASSSLFVGMQSAMSMEAIASGLYSVSIPHLSQLQWLEITNNPEELIYREQLLEGKGGLHNTPGISESVPLYTRDGLRRLDDIAGTSLELLKQEQTYLPNLNSRTLGAPTAGGPSNSDRAWHAIRELVGA